MSASVKEVAAIWIRTCELHGLERSTLRSYRQHVNTHILPVIGDIEVDALTMPKVREFSEHLLMNGSKAMAKKVLGSLRALLNEAQGRGLVATNVAREVKLRNSRRHEEDAVIPTKAEIRLLLAKVPERHRPWLVTALFTGLRSSELRGLSWANINLDKHTIQVVRRADRWNVLSSPKSRAGRRTIPMAPMVHLVLSQWKDRCPKGELDLVFPNGSANVESHANLYHRLFRPLMVACKIVDAEGKPRFSIHSLRHAAASLYIEQGWSPKKIQTLMGHSSIDMTFNVYGHLFDDAEGDLERMAKVERDLLAA